MSGLLPAGVSWSAREGSAYKMPRYSKKGSRLSRGKAMARHRAMARAYRMGAFRGIGGGFRYRRSTGEKKGMDTSLTIVGPILNTTNTNGDCFVLNLVQAGNGYFNRVGRKIFLKSCRLSGTLRYTFNSQATTLSQALTPLRMVVVWDKQPSSGSIPTFDTIFGNTVQAGTESTTVWDNLKYDNTGRFSVLRDCKFVPSPVVQANVGGTGNLVTTDVPFDEFIKLKKRTIFSGDSNPMTIADISSGALYVYFRAVASANDITDWAVWSNAIARLRYTDY